MADMLASEEHLSKSGSEVAEYKAVGEEILKEDLLSESTELNLLVFRFKCESFLFF